jgi:hypothetical protein
MPFRMDMKGVNPKIRLTGNDDKAYLRLFESVAADLRQHSVLKRPQLLSWSWKSQIGQRSRFRHHLHDRDRIIAFLADVRKFHLEKEPLHLPKLFKWLRQRTTDAPLIDELDHLRKAYKAALRGGNVKIVHRDKELSPRELLNIYLHGKYFHNDAQKATLIEELEKGDIVPRVVAMEAAMVVAKTALHLLEIVHRSKPAGSESRA